MKKKFITFIVIIILSIMKVEAHTLEISKYTQEEKQEEFLRQVPSNLKDIYEDENFYISSEWFDEKGVVKKVKELQVLYIENTTIYEKGKVSSTTSKEITKSDYNTRNSRMIVGNCSIEVWGQDCWETSYKRLLILVFEEEIGSKEYTISLVNTWKSIPTIKSYDNIGVYYYAFNLTSANGYQYYYTNSSNVKQVVNYSYNGQNMKISSNNDGVSISQNIANDATSGLQNELWVYGKRSDNYYPKINASYQHATQEISLSTAKNFNFAGNGMGGVFAWNTSYNKWDNMNGLCYNANTNDNILWYC